MGYFWAIYGLFMGYFFLLFSVVSSNFGLCQLLLVPFVIYRLKVWLFSPSPIQCTLISSFNKNRSASRENRTDQ